MSYIYLASPYTADTPEEMEENFKLAEVITAMYTREGNTIYSPIVHFHEIAKKYDLPKDFDFWQNYNTDMISAAKEVLILNKFPDRVKNSVGVQAEIKLAEAWGIPCKLYT